VCLHFSTIQDKFKEKQAKKKLALNELACIETLLPPSQT